MPLARSHDTVGWFARGADILAKVGDVLLPADTGEEVPFSDIYNARDAWALADADVAVALAPARDQIIAAIGPAIDMTLGADCGGLTNWRTTFRFLQMREICAEHGAWIEREKPRFGPEIAERFAMSKEAAAKTDTGEAETRRLITARLDDMLAEGGLLVIPTAADIAPLKSMNAADSAGFRDRTLTLTCIAGLARLPQVTLPVAKVKGAPVGISLIARHGRDRALLALAERLASQLLS
jgi:amidase